MDRASVESFELEQPAAFRDSAMFVEFYGLREQPFGVTPDPKFLYLGEGHREALAALFYGIESGRGFSALAAEPGMGKTSLLMRLLESMQESARTAFLFQTEGSSREFLRALLNDLGIVPRGQDLAATHEALNETLLAELNAGRRVIVVIDEAQNLSEKTLESVRLLSNFETPVAKLMHIILAGQPKLSEKLAKPSLTQLRQRVSTVISLKPFRSEETVGYIKHRLTKAGLKGQVPFSPDALLLIARSSKGIPRNINNICFQALSLGFATQTRLIGTQIIREVLADLEIETADGASRRATESAVPSAPNVAAHWPYLPPQTDPGETNYFAPPKRRSWGMKVFSVLAGAALTFAGLVLFSANKAKAGFNPGQLRDVVLGTSGRDVDQPPALPSRLKPPAAPAIEKSQIATLDTEPVGGQNESAEDGDNRSARSEARAAAARRNEDSGDAHVVLLQRAQSTFEIARNYLGRSNWKAVDQIRSLNPQIRGGYQVLPAGTRVVLPGPDPAKRKTSGKAQASNADANSNADAKVTFTGKSSLVRVYKQETLFQFALDQYGKSGWEIVSRIRSLNPQLRDPYQVLQQGQWIRVPELAQER
jgi:type II secretory pathway predicted ATPase ExeA/phage tail protein X